MNIAKAQELVNTISVATRKMYDIEVHESKGSPFIVIFEPSFLSVPIDETMEITDNSVTYDIRNKILSVSIWKAKKIMHTTVFNR